MEKTNSPALYKLIKTTKGNIIICQEQTRKIALLRGEDGRLLTKKDIENVGLCLKLSQIMLATKYVAGTFDKAVEEAKALLETN